MELGQQLYSMNSYNMLWNKKGLHTFTYILRVGIIKIPFTAFEVLVIYNCLDPLIFFLLTFSLEAGCQFIDQILQSKVKIVARISGSIEV